MNRKKLSAGETDALLQTLQQRFEKNKTRHSGVNWNEVEKKLRAHADILWSVQQMEASGGEPDLLPGLKKGELLIVDCSPETPKERRSICYDKEALDKRKEHKPRDSAMEMAAAMGVELLDEELYRHLQQFGKFDTKTSSWIQTPAAIRKLGGALFCDRRYDHVFVYHNGADSYYAVRGFRAFVKL